MITSENVNELFTALAAAQREMKNPEKNRTATIPLKSGGKYSYKYADLPITFDTIREALGKNGLAHTCATIFKGEHFVLEMRLGHTSGQWVQSEWPLFVGDDPKTMAASITYGTRYLFNCLTGISGDEDTDSDPETSNLPEKPKAPIAPKQGPVVPNKKETFEKNGCISPAQAERLYAIAHDHKWSGPEVKAMLSSEFGIDSSLKIPREKYDIVVNILETRKSETEFNETFGDLPI